MKKIVISTFLSMTAFADPHQIIIDPYLSSYVGADDLIMAHEMIEAINLSKYTHLDFSHSSYWNRLARFSELFFVWEPINYTTMVAQHEIFGHGYRVRSTPSAEVDKYGIGVPPPYGVGGGYTSYYLDDDQISVFQDACIASAGVESTAILANRLRLKWLKQQKIKPQQTSLYLFSQHDITHYIFHSYSLDMNLVGDDMRDYADSLQRIYGNDKMTIKKLRNEAYLNFLDPFTYFSVYAWYNYIMHGTETPIPMIPIGSYKYLPSIRMGLTPFGTEVYLENFLIKDGVPFYFYLRGGSFAGHQYTGLGMEHSNLWKIGSMSLGFRADVWLQPNVDFRSARYSCTELNEGEWKDLHFNHSRLGTSISLMCQRRLWSEGELFLQIGGKTQGFIPGEELSSAMTLRMGLNLVW